MRIEISAFVMRPSVLAWEISPGQNHRLRQAQPVALPCGVPRNENRRPCRTPLFVYILHNRRIRIIMFCCLYCTSCIQYVSNLFACVSCSFFRTRDRHAALAPQRRILLLAKQTKFKQPKRPCKFQTQQRRKSADTCGDKHI